MRTLVLGLGNDLAGDDAVGVLVARALYVELDGVADVVESSAAGLALIEGEKGKENGADVIAIMTPNDSHFELASAALSPLR